ncbi:MAG: hypothetical protein KKC23_04380 [Proteobacteria bacterium]|nr:hypothetical protein [Pseudomonadota bacterium]MCG2736795.1 hypothetical protein [Candidatus Methanoperedenaceae archaeon]MCG2826406.1 hypothetical protein [Thermoplasmatales archaeon]
MRREIITIWICIILLSLVFSSGCITKEKKEGKSTKTIDTDGDGVVDSEDAFPLNPNEWVDSDGDGYGDNSDEFIDNPNEWVDNDRDGVGDNADEDDDNDGYPDDADAFPKNASEWDDWDKDGIGDNSDPFLVLTLTHATDETDDSNFCPRFGDDCIYFVTYNWWLFSDPPTVDSQDINRYGISSGEIMSIYHDNKKTPAYYGSMEIETILEITASSSRIFFTRNDIIYEDNTMYSGYASDLLKVESNTYATTIKDCGKYEYCHSLDIWDNRLVFVYEAYDKKSVYLYEDALTLIEAPNSYDPDIDNSSIVYIHETEEGTVVRIYSNGTRINLTEFATGVAFHRPKIYEGAVIYEREEGNNTDIYYYDKKSEIHRRLTCTSEREYVYDFDGKRALFYRASNDKAVEGLYVIDVSTGNENRISDFGSNARISGEYATFAASENIYLANIK